MSNKLKKINLQDIRVKLSTTFVIKNVCKYCGTPPLTFYYFTSKSFCKNIKNFQKEDEFVNRFLSVYCPINPKTPTSAITNVFTTKYSITDKSFSTRAFKCKNHLDSDEEFSNLEFLTCKCEKTYWGFADLSAEGRPEIKHRQAPKKYPLKFTY